MISASLSLSLPRLGWKSTSTPRSLKICTAAGESASEMRTLGDMGCCGLYRCHRSRKRASLARRMTISIDVVGDALLLQRGGDAFDECRLRLGGKLCHRWIDDLQAHRGIGAQRRIARE